MVGGQVKTANLSLLRATHQITNPTARSATASCATMTEDPSTNFMSRNEGENFRMPVCKELMDLGVF